MLMALRSLVLLGVPVHTLVSWFFFCSFFLLPQDFNLLPCVGLFRWLGAAGFSCSSVQTRLLGFIDFILEPVDFRCLIFGPASKNAK
jgi:hypothetical protein